MNTITTKDGTQIYLPRGPCTTQKNVVNEELLAFVKT
jgi:hypothetical protein